MKVTTKKIEAGRYAVFIDGATTKLVIEKGDPPKYRGRQEWTIGIQRAPNDVWPLACDQNGLEGAVNTIAAILDSVPDIRRAAA